MEEGAMERQAIIDEYKDIRGRLEELGLFNRNTQILISDELGRVAFDAEGKRVAPDLFWDIRAGYAALTSGRYSLEYSRKGLAVRASNDDMAMMFGYIVRCIDPPCRNLTKEHKSPRRNLIQGLPGRKDTSDAGEADISGAGTFTDLIRSGSRPPRINTGRSGRTPASGRIDAWLIRDRGFLVTARNSSELIAACILMEKMCRTEELAPSIGEVKHLNPLLCMKEHREYVDKYSRRSKAAEDDRAARDKNASGKMVTGEDGHCADYELRMDVIEYGKKLVENKLIQATWGNVSFRIDDDRFLITPSGVDYYQIRPEEIVEVRISDGSFEEGLHPSSERRLHQLIYKERADIGAVIHTHSAFCQVFAACREGLHVEEGRAGESHSGWSSDEGLCAEGPDYPCADYAVSGSAKLARNVADVMKDHNGCVMAGHGFVAGGATLEEALARAMKAEEKAERILERK